MTVTANRSSQTDEVNTTVLAAAYAERRLNQRSRATSRSALRVRHPVQKQNIALGELTSTGPSRLRRFMVGFAYLSLAVLVHGSLILGLSQLRQETSRSRERNQVLEKVTVTISPRRPVEKLEPEPQATVPVEARAPVEAAEPEIVSPKTVVREKRVAKAGKRRSKTEPEPSVQADPVDLSNDPAEVVDAKPRRRVVGISFESTVSGGQGPSFAVGNTRMGQTEERASDPSRVEKLRGEAIRVGERERVGPNRVATAIPSAKEEFKKPRRISDVDLKYPRALKEQGIEGNVVVLIRVAADGSVTRVKVIKSSGYPEFDDAATRAATSERFTPATRDGEPVDYSIQYTYRFRIKQV